MPGLTQRVERLTGVAQARAVAAAAREQPALDPVALFEQVIGPADDWQQRVLRSTAPRVLMNITRQGGKSLAAAAIAYHTAAYRPGAQVLILAPAQRQAIEALRKVLLFHRALAGTIPSGSETQMRLELANGSRVIALPGSEKTTRGFSAIDLLIVDEAARVPTELYLAVRPMLAVSGGRLVALSTPFGTRGWFWEAWRSQEAWERYEVPATQCPRISVSFLAEEERTVGAFWFEQEYMCAFLDAQSAAFASADIAAAFGDEVVTWQL